MRVICVDSVYKIFLCWVVVLGCLYFSTAFLSLAPPTPRRVLSPLDTRLFSVGAAFNPFTTKNKNQKIKWFDAELQEFYEFVEAQPLLNAKQELQYGKALKMWQSVEAFRSQLQKKLTLKYQKLLELQNSTAVANSTASEAGLNVLTCSDNPLVIIKTNTEHDGYQHIVTDEELAKYLGCTVDTIHKMAKYAKISKTRLLNSNLKLVLAVVSRYRTASISNTELISEGTRGLAKAVLRYDYSKGFRFATYATWYVHQAIADHVRWRKHPAKMPSKYLVLLRKVKQYTTDYKARTGNSPSVALLAHALGQSHQDIVKVLNMQTYPVLLGQQIKNTNNNKNDLQGRTFADIIPSQIAQPQNHYEHRALRRDMERMMALNLNDVERDVLRLRLGLDDGRIKPIKEIGKRFKITWTQVRNVEKSAMDKLLVCPELQEVMNSFQVTFDSAVSI